MFHTLPPHSPHALQFGSFWTDGQICSATSRLLLHSSIAPAFLKRLKERAESIRISDPLEKGCRMGALVSSFDWGSGAEQSVGVYAWPTRRQRASASATHCRRAAAWARW